MSDPKEWMADIASQHEGSYVELYEKVYAAVARGEGEVPWAEVAERHEWLREWAAEQQLDGTGKKRSEEHTSELQSRENLVCRLLLEKKKKKNNEGYKAHN